MLFRFRTLPRLWAVLLILVNAGGLLFLGTIYGQLTVAAAAAAIAVMAVIYARLGFVRLLGIGHVFWIPMLIGFATHLPDRSTQPQLFSWVLALIVCNSLSLIVDTVDFVRYVRGEREPHYVWKPVMQ